MSIIPWECSHSDAEWVTIPCREITMIGSADSNRVIIAGSGFIRSLGMSPLSINGRVACTKVIFFEPINGYIVLVPSDRLALLGSGNRVIRKRCFATFSCDSHSHWTENSYQNLDWSPHDFEELIDIVYSLCAGRPDLRHRVQALADKLRGEQNEPTRQSA